MGDLRSNIRDEILEKRMKEENKKNNLPPIMNGGSTNEIIQGGSNSKYDIPKNSKILQDLIEYKSMNFADANIFKAIYRKGSCDHSTTERDANKILWFAARECKRLNLEDSAKELITRFNQGEKLEDLTKEYSITKIK